MAALAKQIPEFARQTRKVICIGRNYVDHVKELGNARPSEPFFFLKPTTSIIGSGGSVLVRRGEEVHHEVELALVMKSRLSRAHGPQAGLDAIGGYAVGIDMTSRTLQNQAKEKRLPWTMAKGRDTFLPLSGLLNRTLVPDPMAAELFLKVNGQVRQKDATKLMMFQIPEILAAITSVMTLEPHDIVLTGTPKGVGPVRPGDKIEAGLLLDGNAVEEAKLHVGVEEMD